MASAVFIEEALIGFYIEGVQITGVFLTHSFFDRYQKGKFIEEKQMNKNSILDKQKGYYNSVWFKIERFLDRHNHLMEFIRTILALMVLCMQFYILTRLG